MHLVECPACGDVAGLADLASSPDGWREIDTSDKTAVQVCGAHDGESDDYVLWQIIERNGEDFLPGPDSALRVAVEVLTCPVRAFASVVGPPYAVVMGIAEGTASVAIGVAGIPYRHGRALLAYARKRVAEVL